MMRKLRDMCWEAMALSLVLSMNVSAATLARQCGAIGIVTYDPLPAQTVPAVMLARQCGAVGIVTYDPAETQTTGVPVPYAWLDSYVTGVAHTSEAYETSAMSTAANGRKVWECYVLGLDPEVATNDFRIVSIELVDDKPKVEWEPKTNRWTGAEIQAVLKGAERLEGPWAEVPEDGGSPGTARPTMRFFKVVVELP